MADSESTIREDAGREGMSLAVSRTILGLSLLALFTYTLFAGLDMPFRASMLPVFASSLALPLTLLAIYVEWKTDHNTKTQADDSSGDLAVSESEVSVDAFRRVRYFFIWFVCLIASAHLLGFLIGLPLMVLIYLLAHREPLKLSVFLSAIVLVILYGGFQKGLVLPLPEGVLTMMLFGG
ncbi:MAG: hypothetical protein CMD66_00300 [Gammaproteobacteria bacterium]|nr:hypothetical protein [Gammaproteobacteria bacterium]